MCVGLLWVWWAGASGLGWVGTSGSSSLADRALQGAQEHLRPVDVALRPLDEHIDLVESVVDVAGVEARNLS